MDLDHLVSLVADNNLNELVDGIVEYYEDSVFPEAQGDVDLKNKKLADANREQPQHSFKYGKHKAVLKAILKMADERKNQKFAQLIRKHAEGSNYALDNVSRKQWAEGDETLTPYINTQAKILYLFTEIDIICKAFEARGYALKNLTELRLHEMDDALI